MALVFYIRVWKMQQCPFIYEFLNLGIAMLIMPVAPDILPNLGSKLSPFAHRQTPGKQDNNCYPSTALLTFKSPI